MKILFSPSETKVTGGSFPPISENTFLFPTCYPFQKEILDTYQNYLKSQDDEKLKKLFGIKKENDLLANKSVDIYHDKTMKAIQRYMGVAYDYLDYPTLDKNAQNFLEKNLIIFSNLFGPISGGDYIPYYKLKQGEKLKDLKIESYYHNRCQKVLDSFFEDQFIIDLRAGFYLKFYKSAYPYITLKFIKNGKVVSHWAKAYRGLVVRELAKYQPENEKAFSQIAFKNLSILEIQKSGLKTEYIYEILS